MSHKPNSFLIRKISFRVPLSLPFILQSYESGDCRVLEGHFLSPFAIHHPEIMPKVAKTAR